MTFYDEAAQTALDMLAEFGATVSLEKTTGGTFDPVEGKETGATPDSQDVQAVFSDYSLQESGIALEDGTQILSSDKKITIAAKGLSWVPEVNHIINGEWIIQNVKEVNPAGTPIIYICQGRK